MEQDEHKVSKFDELHDDALHIISEYVDETDYGNLANVSTKWRGVISEKFKDSQKFAQNFVDQFKPDELTLESILAHVKLLAAIKPDYEGIEASAAYIDKGLETALANKTWSLKSLLCTIYPASKIGRRTANIYTNNSKPPKSQDGFLVVNGGANVKISLLCLKPLVKSQSIDLVYTRKAAKGDTIKIGVSLGDYELQEHDLLLPDSLYLNTAKATGPFSETVKTHSGWTNEADAPALAALLHETALFADPPGAGVWNRFYFAKKILERVLIVDRQPGTDMYTVRDVCV